MLLLVHKARHVLPHPVEQLPPQLPLHTLPQLTPQLLVHPPPQLPLQDEHPVDEPPPVPGYGSSISHDVSNEGIATTAKIGNAAVAAFLKNERRFMRSFFMFSEF